MIITASLKLEHHRLESILASSKHTTLKEIADSDYELNLKWLEDSRIEVTGKMWSITRVAEDWQPVDFKLDGFTEDDEL